MAEVRASATASPPPMVLVQQMNTNDCGIASAAMIVSATYVEAWAKLAPPPEDEESLHGYHQRETEFFNEQGWWPSAQLVLKTVVDLEKLDSIIDDEEKFKDAVEQSQRVRLVMAFADGAKPDHVVVFDREQSDVVFDPSRGRVAISVLLDDAGLQTYSGFLGLTAFRYRPAQPIETLIKTEK